MNNSTTLKQSHYIIATFIAMTLHYSSALANDLPEIKQEGGITYVTGGIGDEERSALKAVQHDYNLHVLSAAGTAGEYPGDTHITIFDSHNHKLLDTDADPLFYAKVPAGHYSVEESSGGQSKKQTIVIAANKPDNITFRWK